MPHTLYSKFFIGASILKIFEFRTHDELRFVGLEGQLELVGDIGSSLMQVSSISIVDDILDVVRLFWLLTYGSSIDLHKSLDDDDDDEDDFCCVRKCCFDGRFNNLKFKLFWNVVELSRHIEFLIL